MGQTSKKKDNSKKHGKAERDRAAAAVKSKAKEEKKAKAAARRAAEEPQAPLGGRLSELLRLPQGPVDVTSFDPTAITGFPGDQEDIAGVDAELEKILTEVQERLYAEGMSNPTGAPSVLLVLQGMDAAGKGGTIKHAIGMVDPQGVHIKGFKAPTEEERQHDFLWRMWNEVPAPGVIGIFDRSHYEDVLIARVDGLVPEEEWQSRYDKINEFERQLTDRGTRVIKCFLNESKTVQKERLMARLEDPAKYWKYNAGDLDTRSKWDQYMAAYGDALSRCNTEVAPWYVIPSDHKWYRDWAVAKLVCEVLEDMHLQWPAATFDVEAEKVRVQES